MEGTPSKPQTQTPEPLQSPCSNQNKRLPDLYNVNGLVNLGNTCYMNSVLQCLFNTVELNVFFFRHLELKEDNIVFQYSLLFSDMKKVNSSAVSPLKFKQSFSSIHSDFDDELQHDAHDFLSKLLTSMKKQLNGLPHLFMYPLIYLNEMKEKKFAVFKLAEETLLKRELANQTVIDDIFFGLYNNSMTCPSCRQESNNCFFHPSLHLALPRSKKEITLHFYQFDQEDGKCNRINTSIYEKTKMSTLRHLINSHKPRVSFDDITALPIPRQNDNLNTVWDYYDRGNEILFYERKKEESIYVFAKLAKDVLIDMYCFKANQLSSISDLKEFIAEEFGFESNDISFHLYHNSDQCFICHSQNKFCALEGKHKISHLLQAANGDLILEMRVSYFNRSHQGNSFKTVTDITLKDCLAYFTSFDELPSKCSGCKRKGLIIKRTTIAYPPKILIIQLKRFKLTANDDSKNEALIDFPLKLDIEDYLTAPTLKCNYGLYGIIEHSGSASSGHYTAKCLNSRALWIEIDDDTLSPPKSTGVITQNAYLLFYNRIEA